MFTQMNNALVGSGNFTGGLSSVRRVLVILCIWCMPGVHSILPRQRRSYQGLPEHAGGTGRISHDGRSPIQVPPVSSSSMMMKVPSESAVVIQDPRISAMGIHKPLSSCTSMLLHASREEFCQSPDDAGANEEYEESVVQPMTESSSMAESSSSCARGQEGGDMWSHFVLFVLGMFSYAIFCIGPKG